MLEIQTAHEDLLSLAACVARNMPRDIESTPDRGQAELCDLIATHVVKWARGAIAHSGSVGNHWDHLADSGAGVPLYDVADAIVNDITEYLSTYTGTTRD